MKRFVIVLCAAAAWTAGAGTLPAPPKIASLMVRDAPVEYAMWIISEAWGRHIVVNESAKKARVRLFLRDIDAMSAMKAVCHANGLWYREDPSSGVIHVETLDDFLHGKNLNDRKFVEVVTVVYPRAEDVGQNLKELFQDMVVYNLPDENSEDEQDDIDRALERLGQLSSLSVLTEDAKTGSSGGASRLRNSGRSTRGSRRTRARSSESVNDMREFHDDMKQITRDGQEVVRAQDGTPERVNPNVVFVAAARRSNLLLIRSSDPETLKQVREVAASLDRPKAQVLLEMKVLRLDITDSKERVFDVAWKDTDGGDTVMGGFGNSLQMPDLSVIGYGGADTARRAAFQYVSKHIQARIKFLDGKNRIRVLAKPSLMVADLEASRIFVGEERTILLDSQISTTYVGTENPVPAFSVNNQTERRHIGTTLVITPKIHADETVTIRMMHENSSIGPSVTISASSSNAFETVSINKQSIASTVVAKSGELVALGGLVTHEKTEDVSRVPWLADIPYIGKFLFENKVETDHTYELVVLVRPFVMLTPVTAEQLSRHYKERVDAQRDL